MWVISSELLTNETGYIVIHAEYDELVWSMWGTIILYTYDLRWEVVPRDCPLTRYVKLGFAHAPGMPETFLPPPTSKETAR